MNNMDIDTLKRKEVLTSDEAKAVCETDSKWAKEYLFHNAWSDTYLNLAVYSEADKEEFDFRREMGF